MRRRATSRSRRCGGSPRCGGDQGRSFDGCCDWNNIIDLPGANSKPLAYPARLEAVLQKNYRM